MKMTRLALSLALMITLAAGGSWIAASAQDANNNAPASGTHNWDGSGKGHGKMDKAQWQAKRAEMQQRFAKELNLTADQQAKIKSIRQSFREAHKGEFEAMKAKRQELRQLKQSGADEQTLKAKREEMKSQFSGLKAAREQMQSQIKAILTPDQQAKMEAMRQQHMQNCGKHHHKEEQKG